jgi:hypothetical protein
MPEKKITPFGLIGSIMTLAAFVGMVFTVDARYITRAEAADKTAGVIQQQQLDRTETDIDLVELEMKFLEEKIARQAMENRRLAAEGQSQIVNPDDEKYQLELQSDK